MLLVGVHGIKIRYRNIAIIALIVDICLPMTTKIWRMRVGVLNNINFRSGQYAKSCSEFNRLSNYTFSYALTTVYPYLSHVARAHGRPRVANYNTKTVAQFYGFMYSLCVYTYQYVHI